MSLNLVFLASNNGSAMRAAQKAIMEGVLDAKISLVISNKPSARALEFAEQNNIMTRAITETEILLSAIRKAKPDYIVLSGYLKKIPAALLAENIAPIINIHPSLLPKFGGRGMFGLNVHKAVIAAGETETGASIHFVSENYDEGKIINQIKLPVLANDSPESLAKRVMAVEEKLMVETLKTICKKLA